MNTPTLEIRTLGALDVRVCGRPVAPTRTQKCLWTLTYLALHHGRAVHREALAERLWPESSPASARDNLRYALRDLRQALGDANDALVSSPLYLTLDRQLCWSDVGAFDEAIRLQANVALLKQGLELYRGPFLEGCRDDWAAEAREEREGLFVEAIERLAEKLPAPEAIPLLDRALASRPLRESLVGALMGTLARAGNLVEMAQVYHDFRARLPLRQLPGSELVELYERLRRDTARPAPAPTGAWREPPGGILDADSRVYLDRPAGARVLQAIDRGESIVRLKGSRQSGKSNLLARAVRRARQNGALVRHADIATLSAAELESLESFVDALGRSLGEDGAGGGASPFPPLVQLERQLLRSLDEPGRRLVWVLDGVDRLFQRPYREEFFSKVRAWHNRAAIDYEGPLSHLTIALAYSTEAKRFITAEDRSPFNVGVLCELSDFTDAEQAALNERLGSPLRSPGELERFRKLVGGHPYLSHLGIDALAGGATLEVLEESTALTDANPFRANLSPLLRDFRSSPELREATGLVLSGDTRALTDDQLFLLEIAGIVVGETVASTRMRCGLYEAVLRRELSR